MRLGKFTAGRFSKERLSSVCVILCGLFSVRLPAHTGKCTVRISYKLSPKLYAASFALLPLVNDLGVCLDISSGRTSAGPPSDIKLSRRHAWTVLYGIRFFPENINLFAIILPFVKTEPAQNWITQTSLPHINALPTQRYKKFSTVCLVVCLVFVFCYTLFLSCVCLIYN